MAKVVFIGAGSLGFTRGLVRDLLSFPLLRDSTIALVDINKERLTFAKRMIEKIVAMGNYPAKVIATMDRTEVLKGADAVCVTILCGSTNVWQHDILIPKKYGIDINVGDTRGPSGIFRALHAVTQAGNLDRRRALHGVTQHGHGIRIVEHDRVWAQPFHVPANVQQGRNGAQGAKDAARSAGVADIDVDPIFLGNQDVMLPDVRAAA